MKSVTPLVVGMLTLLGACAAQWSVDRFAAPDYDVAAQRSFYWKGGEFGTPTAVDPALETSASASIHDVVVAELKHKGYEEVADAASADLAISFQVAGLRRTVVPKDKRVGAPSPNEVLTPGAVPPPPLSELPREQTVREGSVLVFADDAKTGRLVWRGLVAAEVRGSSSNEKSTRLVTDIARRIAQEFPARQVK